MSVLDCINEFFPTLLVTKIIIMFLSELICVIMIAYCCTLVFCLILYHVAEIQPVYQD